MKKNKSKDYESDESLQITPKKSPSLKHYLTKLKYFTRSTVLFIAMEFRATYALYTIIALFLGNISYGTSLNLEFYDYVNYFLLLIMIILWLFVTWIDVVLIILWSYRKWSNILALGIYIGSYREWIIYRTMMLIAYVLFGILGAGIFYFAKVDVSIFSSDSVSTWIGFSFNVVKLIFAEVLVIVKINSLLSYNGSSSYAYVKKLMKTKLPQINVDLFSCAFVSSNFIVQSVIQMCSIARNKEEVDRFELIETFSHYPWSYFSKLKDEEVEEIVNFFLDYGTQYRENWIETFCFAPFFSNRFYKYWCCCNKNGIRTRIEVLPNSRKGKRASFRIKTNRVTPIEKVLDEVEDDFQEVTNKIAEIV